MITFWRELWPILTARTRRRLKLASAGMVGVALLEGIGMLTLVPLLQLLTSNDFTADSSAVRAMRDLFGREGGDLARTLGILAFTVFLAKGLLAIAILRWSTRFAMEEEANLIGRLATTYIAAPVEVQYRTNTSDFQRTINTSVRQLFSQAFVGGFSSLGDLLSIFIVATILVVSDPTVALIGAAYLLFAVGIYQRVIQRVVRRAAAQVHAEQAMIFREVQQALVASKEIKVRGTERWFAERVEGARRRLLDAYRIISLDSIQPRYVLELIMAGAAGVVGLYTCSTRSSEAATASIGLFLASGFRVLAPLNKVFTGFNQARTATPGVRQVRRDLATIEGPALAELSAGERVQLPAQLQVELRDVSFRYGDGPLVLHDINLSVAPGEAIALVGGSGAGKSTLVDLILGLLTPDSGELLIQGRRIQEVRRAWQAHVAYVPQTIALLDDTVRANIELGLERDDERLWEAVRAAQLEEVIAELPEGLDTRIGERGVRLSGGQRQRLGVARALYRRPAVLVLDEATSALDNETEARLTSILDGLRGSITTITVAHRLSTVRNADRTYLMANGRVVDAGTFDELAARNEDFARLVELAAVTGTPG